MASLKDLRTPDCNSVKSTQKITSAMKMVAAAKLRRAQEQAEAARPYAERMERMLGSVAASLTGRAEGARRMLAGTGKDDRVHLLVVGDVRPRPVRGLQLQSIVRAARKPDGERADGRRQDGQRFVCVGRKGRGQSAAPRLGRCLIVGYYTDDVGRRTAGLRGCARRSPVPS